MARKIGVTRRDVVAAGLAVADADGVAAVSLAAVSLAFGEVLRDAVLGRSDEDAVRSFSHAYRSWATTFPGRYDLTLTPIDPDDAERRDGARLALGAIQAVIRGFGLEDAEAVKAGRSLRAAMDGFTRLENLDVMGRGDHDAEFGFLVDLLVDGIRSAAGIPATS